MGVSVDTGRGRKGNAELNLVPFIDLLSVCITFLIATAVWIDLAAVPVDQAISDGAEATRDDDPPLRVHVGASGIRVGRREQRLLEPIGGDPDWDGVARELALDREAHPTERSVVIVTDDGRPYGDMIRALDVALAEGYDRPLLGGGPAEL